MQSYRVNELSLKIPLPNTITEICMRLFADCFKALLAFAILVPSKNALHSSVELDCCNPAKTARLWHLVLSNSSVLKAICERI